MKIVLLRGCSGAGKSTKANQMVSDFVDSNPDCLAKICSADQFFIKEGKYEFNSRKLGLAHSWCRDQTEEAMKSGTHLVVLDNTSSRRRELKPYYELARKYNYEVEEIIVGGLSDEDLKLYASRNIHNVPLNVIKKQARRIKR